MVLCMYVSLGSVDELLLGGVYIFLGYPRALVWCFGFDI